MSKDCTAPTRQVALTIAVNRLDKKDEPTVRYEIEPSGFAFVKEDGSHCNLADRENEVTDLKYKIDPDGNRELVEIWVPKHRLPKRFRDFLPANFYSVSTYTSWF